MGEAVGLKKPEDVAEQAQPEVDEAEQVPQEIPQESPQVSEEVPPEVPQETPETQEPGLLERFEEAVGLKKPEDAPEQVQQEADEANRRLEQPSVASTQPSRVVYAHPGSFQQGNQIQAPQGSGFARYVAHAHAPVQYAQPVPVAAQAPVKQTSTAQYIPPNFVPVAPASSYAAPASILKPPAAAVTTFKAPAGAYVAPVVSTPAPASSYVSPSSAAPQAAHTASATYSVPTVIAQPPGAMQLSRAAQVAPHVTGQTAPLVGQTAYAARAVQSRQ